VGCEGPEPIDALRACEDAVCLSSAIEPAYRTTPEQVIAWLRAEADPVTQVAAIDQLAYLFPEDAQALCDAMPQPSEARARCNRRNVRPHLYGEVGSHKRERKRRAGSADGPRSSQLPVPASVAARWESTEPRDLACGGQARALCAVAAAQTAARDGASTEEIGGRCLSGSPDRDQAYSECLFKAAEALAESRKADGISSALALCSGSQFAPMCVAHLMTLASPPVPSAQTAGAADIAEAAAVPTAFQAAAPEHGALYVDRFWASWVYTSYKQAAEVTGALLELLPEEARHHVPVAAAHRLMTLQGPSTFEAEVDRLRIALSRREDQTLAPAYEDARTRMKRQLWLVDAAGEEALATTWMMGPARRIRVADPDLELQIAVLEAAGQLNAAPPASFFLSALGAPRRDPRVRWTAARIAAALEPEIAAQRTDDDPLVAARLKGTSNRKTRPRTLKRAPTPAQPQPPEAGSPRD